MEVQAQISPSSVNKLSYSLSSWYFFPQNNAGTTLLFSLATKLILLPLVTWIKLIRLVVEKKKGRLHTFCWKTWLEGLGKASLSVHTQADSGQYIHPTFFGSPPYSKLDAMHIHGSSNVIETKTKQAFDSKIFSISKRNEPDYSKKNLRSKQNEPSILEIFRYRNETNHVIPKLFRI